MNEEQIDKLDDLNILYNALKYTDDEADIVAVSNFVENTYKKSEEIRDLF